MKPQGRSARQRTRLFWVAAVAVITPLVLILGVIALAGLLVGGVVRGTRQALPARPVRPVGVPGLLTLEPAARERLEAASHEVGLSRAA